MSDFRFKCSPPSDLARRDLNQRVNIKDSAYATYPPRPGAISAVTDGPPEDMNEMPPAMDPSVEYPVYDGSDLVRRKAI